MFNKILIANRGEIALRILKTLKKLNIKSVAIYADVDKNEPFVTNADEAYPLFACEAKDSYLNIDKIIKIAKDSNADAIHPGYGFLSENVEFAQALKDNQIVFIGPSIEAINIMGSKQISKQTLQKHNISLIHGYHGDITDEKLLLDKAHEIGWPILLKAAGGGGGKGMRIVENANDFMQALSGAKREAMAFFKDDTIIIEKYLKNPRHIEVQILADNYGNVLHLFERDCSIQRRHQKIIEEAPAPNLSTTLLEKLRLEATKIASIINYSGAGTIEFLVVDDNFYFMEMNTRLQVEHPVTEMITNLDLVELQIQIAANQELPFTQNDITYQGHAIELRIYAEDPNNNFMPSTGKISFLHEPQDKNIRIDSSIITNSEISIYYDPMIAKLIAYGEDRPSAINTLISALNNYYIGGIKTNIEFLKAIITSPDFINTKLNTNFLTTHKINLVKPDAILISALASAYDYHKAGNYKINTLSYDTFSYQMNLKSRWESKYFIEDEQFKVLLTPNNNESFNAIINDTNFNITVSCIKDNQFHISINSIRYEVFIEDKENYYIFYTHLGNIKVTIPTYNYAPSKNLTNSLTAPMSSKIVAIIKNTGDTVKQGESIIVLEAMKMEHTVYAPHNGILKEIYFAIGDQVPEGALLGDIDKGC